MKRRKVAGQILAAATLVVAADTTWAASYSWDPLKKGPTTGASGGSGSWNNTAGNNLWYDGDSASGTYNTDVVWTTGSDAVFGGTGGAVTVSSTSAPNKMTINSDGYTFIGNLGVGPSLTAPTAADMLFVHGNVQFNGGLTMGSFVGVTIDSNKTLTLSGGGRLYKVTGGSVSVTGGTLNIGPASLNTAVTQTGGTAISSVNGQNPVIGASGTGSWTLANSNAVINVSQSTVTAAGPNFDIGGGASNTGNGTLNINLGIVSVSSSALRIGAGNNTGVVNVAGGSLVVTGASAYSFLYITESGGGTGTLNITNGTATVDTIMFGKAATATSGQGTLNLSGTGALYVGVGGISVGKTGNKAAISLSGGTLGATADWSSGLAMTLSGAATIKAGDAGATSHDITLSGNLAGSGSLTKTGGGKLTLASASYNGATQVSAGTLEVNGTIATSALTVASTAVLSGTGTVTNGVSINGSASPAGSGIGKLTVGSATFGVGGSFDVNLGSAGSSDLLAVSGALDITNATLNLSGVSDNSSYIIATYGGKLTGEFASFSNLPDGYKIDYGSGTNSAITLAVPEPSLGLLLPGVAMLRGRRSRRNR